MKHRHALFIVSALLMGANVHATNLSVESLNTNIQACFDLTQDIQAQNQTAAVSAFACNKVIRNDWSSRRVKSNAYLNRGIVYMHQGNETKALRDFVQSARLVPEQKYAHIGAAQLYYSRQQYQLAIEHYDRALAVDKNESVALNRAKALIQFNKQKRNELAQQSRDDSRYKEKLN